MRAFVAITDWDWFSYLSAGELPGEVNFWQPGGNVPFRALQPGEPFLFKLHSPRDFVVGGGFFSYFTILPASFAWKTFGPKNGAQTEQEMRARIEHYRKVKPNPFEDYEIGCILLQAPFPRTRVPCWTSGYSLRKEVGLGQHSDPGVAGSFSSGEGGHV